MVMLPQDEVRKLQLIHWQTTYKKKVSLIVKNSKSMLPKKERTGAERSIKDWQVKIGTRKLVRPLILLGHLHQTPRLEPEWKATRCLMDSTCGSVHVRTMNTWNCSDIMGSQMINSEDSSKHYLVTMARKIPSTCGEKQTQAKQP